MYIARVFAVGIALCAISITNAQAPSHAPKPVPKEDWIRLFNGRDLSGWIPKITHHALGENYANTFRVENGVLKVSYDRYKGFDGQFGHLFYKDPFSYYRLVVEYRFVGKQAPNGPGTWALRNSGAMLHSQKPATMQLDQAFPISIEAQFLGGLSDGKARPTLNVCTPGTDVVYHGAMLRDHCFDSRSKTFDGDQWVHVEMVVLGGSGITHIVNGETILEYTLPQYSSDSEETLPAARPDGTLIDEGYIALQSESHPIEFRKIELLHLAGCMNPKAKNYKPYYVKSEPQQCR
jgi:hypothetical protein